MAKLKIEVKHPEIKVDAETIVAEILKNHGLDEEWLNASYEDMYDIRTMKNFDKGAQLILRHIEEGSSINILVDNDTDGFTSFSIIYQWLKDKGVLNIKPVIAEGKIHGIIAPMIEELADCDLLIIPDAGSSQTEEHKIIQDKGVDILVLDHHEFGEEESPYAVILNPHNPECEYPNKDISGAGVTYKFVEGVDKFFLDSTDYAQYIDLAAIGTVADVMDIREKENKAMVNIGLGDLKNEYFKKYLKTDQRLKKLKKPNAITVGFYMAPPINALIRIGTKEDKYELVRAMVGELPVETVIAKIISLKRKQDTKKEPIVVRMVRNLQKSGRDKEKIIIGEIPDSLPRSMTGLIAGQIANMYDRPALVGRDDESGEYFVCSGRSVNDSNVENFKDFCNDTGLFVFASGHQAAFGAKIKKSNIDKLLEQAAEKMPEVEKITKAEFSIENTNEKGAVIEKVAEVLSEQYGPGFDEIKVLDRLKLKKEDFKLLGEKKNIFKIYNNGVEYIKFRFKGELPQYDCVATIVGKPSMNEWNGSKTPQIIIENFTYEYDL